MTVVRITTMEGERHSTDPTVPNPRSRLLSRRFLRMVSAMPNKPRPENPARSFRIPLDLYRQVQARAAERGETVTDVILRAFRRYVR